MLPIRKFPKWLFRSFNDRNYFPAHPKLFIYIFSLTFMIMFEIDGDDFFEPAIYVSFGVFYTQLAVDVFKWVKHTRSGYSSTKPKITISEKKRIARKKKLKDLLG